MREVSLYITERKVRGIWVEVSQARHFGHVFNNPDSDSRRIINEDRQEMAVLPPGRHYGKDLTWTKIKK